MANRTKHQNAWDHGMISQIPRNSLIMLMTAFAMTVLPHVAQISLWVIGAGLYCVVWRWMIFLGRKNFPSFWLKVALVSATAAGIVISEGITKNLETWAALLVIAFALKLLEMKTRRDAYVVIFIAYFIIAVEFIFNHSMGIVAYELCALILVTAAMVGMNQFHSRVEPFVSIKIAAKILAQAIPLMIVLFILFPRIGPMWVIANPNQQARSGLGSEMTPGDIANLARSDEIVFRAIFKETPPPTRDLYWRGIVYANFVHGTWSAATIPKKFSNIPRVTWFKDIETNKFVPDAKKQNKISYSILLEPTYKVWLFGLDLAIPQTILTGLSYDYRLENNAPVQSLLRYEVESYPEATLNTWLPEYLRLQTTRLDNTDNPRTINFARNLYNESTNTEEFVEKVLDRIRKQAYHYTLEPATLDRGNSIDQFWFNTRSGFCTHYAGAFVNIMRAAGIPARMVGGYHGGEINPHTGHIVVRQYMAHAWAEIWLPNKGWQRVDPTAAVAPSRIEDGLNAALPETDLSSLSSFTTMRLNGIPGLRKAMFLFESLEHRWNLFVIGYDSKIQTDFLQKLLGKITIMKIGLALLAGAVLSILFVGISLLLQRNPQNIHPAIKIFQNFTQQLNKPGLIREPGETPAQFIKNVCTQRNLQENDYQSILIMLNNLLYNPNEKYTKEKFKILKNNLRTLQTKLAI
ncbi:MAG: transglutaminaseTgpA domain-containing protein [Gammaproteobacteria bacterium]